MEMPLSVEIDHDESIEDTSDQLISLSSPCISDIYGDPEVLPRVGDEYQVEIPSLVTESDPTGDLTNMDHAMHVGLSIPIVWVPDKIIMAVSEDSRPKVEISNDVSGYGNGLEGSKYSDDKIDVELLYHQKEKCYLDKHPEDKDFRQMSSADFRNWHLVPGTVGDSWSEDEQESFLLGLYIFGKNLVQVKKFIESKKIGDILSFYYGKFYRSERQRRWSECRKIRSRRCIHGQRIFTGWRQQELLSRLLPHVPEESKITLLEASKSFSEGKLSLEEYVSMLKITVGLSMLVEAIGIGKGKYDLTGIVMEPIKPNQVVSARSEIPIGKACSSLTSEDIIKFLTGDFRLSKARSNDLFWEAVWPRLLARGWHSEQPKNHGYVVSKHSLVFLIPGIKKFSRRKLVKGIQYFDSVSDVLTKVAAEPGLLELEVDASKENRAEEHVWADTKPDQDTSSNHHRHCYLRPKLPDCNLEIMKFTVVDTSLIYGRDSSKMRQLRSLPVNSSGTCSPASLLRETDGDNSDVQVDEPNMPQNNQESYPGICHDDKQGKSVKSLFDSELSENVIPISEKPLVMDDLDSIAIATVDVGELFPTMSNGKISGKNKCHYGHRTKSGRTNYLSPVFKRRRLNACSFEARNWGADASSVGPELKEECPWQSNSCKASPSKAAEVCPLQHVGGPDEKTEFLDTIRSSAMGLSCEHEKPKPRTFIDLNLPHVPSEFEADEAFTEVADSRDDSNIRGPSFLSDLNKQPEDSHLLEASNITSTAHHPAVNSRRQSTRNRPLTTKALEALECGFLNTKRKGRGIKAMSRENSLSRSARQGVSVLVNSSNSGNAGTDAMDSKIEVSNKECLGNTNTVGNSQILLERLGNHVLLGVSQTVYQPEISIGKDSQSG